MAQTSYGTITITDTTDIESIVVEYAQNQDPLTAPINGWGSTRPEWAEGYYIWQRTRTHKYGTSSSADDIGVAVCITGSQGETGRSLTSTTTQYTTAASSATITTDNMGDYIWYTNIPPYNNSTPVYWVRVTNIYSNPSTGYLDVYSGEVADGSGSSSSSSSNGENNLENNITTVYIIYKDEGLTSAVSMSQTALTQSSSNINTIIRLWYRSNSATAPNKPTSHVTQSGNNVDNTWTTTKPIDKDGYRYYYYCDELCTGGGVYKWTDVVLDTSNLSQYEISALTTKVKNFWWDADGAHVASGKNGSEVTTESSSTYGYNSLMGLTGISFGYDNTKVVDLTTTSPALSFYLPPVFNNNVASQGNKVMQLSNNALTFYNPSDGTTAYATLNANGLKLAKGGIQAGTANQSGFVYLSTDNYGNYSINGSSSISDWKEIIGTKFGVRADGTLYASNAVISGTITIGAGSNVYTKTEADDAFDASGDAAAAQAAAIAAAATDATNKANAAQANAIAEIPTNISELTNDSGYQNASQVSGAVSTGISNASVSDLSDGSNYYTSTQTQDYITGLGYQTENEVSSAINTATSNLTTKSDATYRTQRIYRRYTSAQSNLSGPTTWVSTSTDTYTNWTIKIPPLTNDSTKYPYLYTCIQKQTVAQYNNGSGTSCTCTEVLLDDTTTVIDGGALITGSVTANEIIGNKLSAIYADMGNITAGNITKGNNSINFDNSPATLEFKDASTWNVATQGIKYDSDGLAIKGAITATSLTIGSGSDAYDGAAAINISGYDIEIEKNGIDEVEGVSVYLYPVLYHNGVQVPTVEVDYSHFIWYQDDDTIGTEGDGENSGRYLATYGHNYRVIYDFDDGAVGGGTEVQTRTVDPSKYITKISDTGITIHPEVWSNQSSYIQLDGTGMELFNSNGNSIAQYGSTARVGLNNSSRFLMNSDSLEAYDSNNVKYFEVTSSGLSWGGNTAATTDDLEDAAKTATNYISMVDNNGITIHSNNNNNERNILINSNEISIRNGLLPMMTLDNDSLDFNVVDVNAGTISSAATFGARTRIGRVDTGYSKILIDSTSIESGIANIFQIVAKNDTDVVDIILDDDHTSDSIEVNKALDNIYTNFSVDSLSSTSFSSASESYTMSEVANISEGNNFSLVIKVQCVTDNWVQDVIQNYSLFTFVKGTLSTETDSQDVMSYNNTKLGEYNLTVQYISPATFNITISAKKTTVSYAPSSMNVSLYTLSYMSDLELVPIQRYNGDLLFNAVHGRAYLGLDVELADGEAVNGSDKGLYNSVLSLGWQDTLGGIFLSSPNYIGIYGVINILVGNSVTIVAEVNYADTDIVWESSDTSVATVTPYETNSVIIRGVERGACEITVSTSFMDKVFSESLSVRVG